MALAVIRRLVDRGCDEIVLETEETNVAALRLYENLGFVRDKKLPRYYLNGVSAFRLKLWVKPWDEISKEGTGAYSGPADSLDVEVTA